MQFKTNAGERVLVTFRLIAQLELRQGPTLLNSRPAQFGEAGVGIPCGPFFRKGRFSLFLPYPIPPHLGPINIGVF
jgi:hypothetical protein